MTLDINIQTWHIPFIDNTNGVTAMITYGTAQNDVFGGSEYDDFIFGFRGDDTLISGIGNDSLFGGQGDDTFIICPQTDAVVYIDGGRGFDTISLSRDVIDIETVGNKMVIHYDYDMIIIADKVEQIEWS